MLTRTKKYFKDIWEGIWTILVGMVQTWRHLFKPSFTIQYPHEKLELPPGSRAQLFNNIDDCIGCNQCARICPVDCITIQTMKAEKGEEIIGGSETSTGHRKRLHVVRFDIDMAKCCYCNLCTTVCPTECLYMTNNYEFSVFQRPNLLYHFSKYKPEQAEELVAGAKDKRGAYSEIGYNIKGNPHSRWSEQKRGPKKPKAAGKAKAAEERKARRAARKAQQAHGAGTKTEV